MKLKLLFIAVLSVLSIQMFAADNVAGGSGVSRTFSPTRWNTTLVGPYSATLGATSVTNVVAAVPSVVGKIVIVPGAVTDVVTIYNSATAAGITSAKELFKITATSQTIGVPIVYDLLPGMSYSSGVTTVSTVAASTTTLRGYINTDVAR